MTGQINLINILTKIERVTTEKQALPVEFLFYS